ncbi:MAG TPA: ABC transporter permease subunit [Micromonosporaceae bacterium]
MSDVSAIHDIGYQRYRGARLGRSYTRRSLYTHSLRTAYGLGRSAKAKIFPWFAAAVLLLVAIIDVAIRSQSGGKLPLSYVDFPQATALAVLLFLATAAPELVSRDLRSKVLPLYFSRPIRRSDYALAKLGALASAIFLLIAVPLLIIFLGGAFSLPSGKLWHEFTDFLGGLVGAAVMAIVYASIGLLVSSLLARRMVAAAAIVGVFLVTGTVGAAVAALGGGGDSELIGRALGPTQLVESLNVWMVGGNPKHFGHFGWAYLIETIVGTALLVWLLLQRYRTVES